MDAGQLLIIGIPVAILVIIVTSILLFRPTPTVEGDAAAQAPEEVGCRTLLLSIGSNTAGSALTAVLAVRYTIQSCAARICRMRQRLLDAEEGPWTGCSAAG